MSLTISDEAIAFIIKEENSDEAYYNKLCRGFEWPGGASGPTVGIGYDCGYCDKAEIWRDWNGLISVPQIEVLVAASGRTHGSAHEWVQQHRHAVNIPWDVAIQQFNEREVPKWIERVTNVVPNCELLHPSSLGALVSVAYNRGPSFRSPKDRDREMLAITVHMIKKEFALIPDEFRRMKRLWAGTSLAHDLCPRRDHEADLFQAGLDAMKEGVLVSQG